MEVDVVNHDGGGGRPVAAAVVKPPNKNTSSISWISKRIQQVRAQYANMMQLGKNGVCYSKYCNMSSTSTAGSQGSTCYSPLCLQKARAKLDLIALLKRANTLNTTTPLADVADVPNPAAAAPEIKSEDVKKDLESGKDDIVNDGEGEMPAKAIKLENSVVSDLF